MLSLLGEYSWSNNLAKKVFSLYLYSTGTQRQAVSVLSHLGLCESYTNTTRSEHAPSGPTKGAATCASHQASHSEAESPTPSATGAAQSSISESSVPAMETSSIPSSSNTSQPTPMPPPQKPRRRLGTIRLLSDAILSQVRKIAEEYLWAASYDNINLVMRTAEQLVGRNSQLI